MHIVKKLDSFLCPSIFNLVGPFKECGGTYRLSIVCCDTCIQKLSRHVNNGVYFIKKKLIYYDIERNCPGLSKGWEG